MGGVGAGGIWAFFPLTNGYGPTWAAIEVAHGAKILCCLIGCPFLEKELTRSVHRKKKVVSSVADCARILKIPYSPSPILCQIPETMKCSSRERPARDQEDGAPILK